MIALNVLGDAAGNVLQVSSEPLTPAAGLTLVEGVTDAPPEFTEPGALFDDAGRCLWRVSGATITAGAARWPATAALKRAAAARLRQRIDETLLMILALERWQSDGQNVLVLDRSAELSAARARLTQLRDILAGA